MGGQPATAITEINRLQADAWRLKSENDRLWNALDAAEDDAKRYRWLRSTTRCMWRPVALRHITDDNEADRLVDDAMKDEP